MPNVAVAATAAAASTVSLFTANCTRRDTFKMSFAVCILRGGEFEATPMLLLLLLLVGRWLTSTPTAAVAVYCGKESRESRNVFLFPRHLIVCGEAGDWSSIA